MKARTRGAQLRGSEAPHAARRTSSGMVFSREASGIFGKGLLADLTAEGVTDSLPRGAGCHLVGVQRQPADRVSFAVRALPEVPAYLHQTDWVR